jgi:hypothetical protein
VGGFLSNSGLPGNITSVGARSRQEIAEAVARSFDRLPRPRRPWEGPHRRLAIFDAAAVVLTHYQLDANHPRIRQGSFGSILPVSHE